MESPPIVCFSQSVKPGFLLVVRTIFKNQQWRVKENLLRFGHGHAVLFIFSGIAFIPVKPGYLADFNHFCIFSSYTFSLEKSLGMISGKLNAFTRTKIQLSTTLLKRRR